MTDTTYPPSADFTAKALIDADTYAGMFSRRKDASKIALLWLVDHLKTCGFTLFDTQFLTPHLATLGGVEIPRAEYRARLAEALEGDADFTAHPLPSDPQEVLQRITQTSYRA